MGKHNISVLLVEDDRLSLVIYSEFIRNIVSDVYTATDGIQGVAVFTEKKPDIIITDIMMPGMDGLEMIRKIKKINPRVKVIMISGHSEVDYFIRSIDLGVDGYLLKPIDNIRLQDKIHELGEQIMLSKKVAETEKKFQDFAALLPQVVFEADLEGRLTFVNQIALKMFNYNKKDINDGLYLHDVIVQDKEDDQKDIQEIISTAKNFKEKEVICKTKTGKFFPALIYTSGIFEDDVLTGTRGVMVDISSRKKMMEELKSLNHELEEKVRERTIRLSDEIKEKEKAEKALIMAKEKAEESDYLKGIFLANVSHEIQTPIKAIISFSNLLHAPKQSDKRRQELVGIIESNSNALLNLTNDILEFTRLQSNTIKLYRINFDLNLFLKELFPVFETLKRRKDHEGVELKLSLGHKNKEIQINSDPSRLRQVFTNLISNAFKFTHNGYVEYGYRTDGASIQFFVKDTGLGISKPYQRKIFERFIQEPKPLSIKKEGTGLGLPITHSLIRMLGGKIWVESDLGKGSTFFFEIPDITLTDKEHTEDEAASWKDKQILIIEDEIEDYFALEEILKNKIKIHFLNSPEQAMEFCKKNKDIDLCLLSWSSDQNLELIHSIRNIISERPVIALCDKEVKGAKRKEIDNYFDGMLRKPFEEKEIMALLKNHLG
ncbi:MAG: response regulator [Bacteroidota bacterium]